MFLSFFLSSILAALASCLIDSAILRGAVENRRIPLSLLSSFAIARTREHPIRFRLAGLAHVRLKFSLLALSCVAAQQPRRSCRRPSRRKSSRRSSRLPGAEDPHRDAHSDALSRPESAQAAYR